MNNKNNILVIIPARAGSKGIPKKNIKLLNGKPLISYTIESAKKIVPLADICVSTDGSEIKQIAENYGIKVPFLRPEHLACDTSGTYEVLIHALDYYEQQGKTYEIVLLLQPTSPFRQINHIKEAIESYSSDLDMVVSVKETKVNPYYNLFEEDKGYLVKSKKGKFSRRQDIPKVYEYNGAIYVINVKTLKENKMADFSKVKKYVMDDISSIDLDDKLDWKFCELIIKEGLVRL